MAVHDRHYIGPRAVDLAVDEALEHRLASRFANIGVERIAVQVVLDQVLFVHQFRSDGARQVVALRVARRAQADVAVGIDDAVRGEDAVSRDEVFQRLRNRLPFSRL